MRGKRDQGERRGERGKGRGKRGKGRGERAEGRGVRESGERERGGEGEKVREGVGVMGAEEREGPARLVLPRLALA